jgi:hypothetical protein
MLIRDVLFSGVFGDPDHDQIMIKNMVAKGKPQSVGNKIHS